MSRSKDEGDQSPETTEAGQFKSREADPIEVSEHHAVLHATESHQAESHQAVLSASSSHWEESGEAPPFGKPTHIDTYQGSLTLKSLAEKGVITSLALATTQSVLRLSGEKDERVAIAMALAQVALQLGHLGLRLDHIARDFSPEILRDLWERQSIESPEDGGVM